MPRKHWTKRRRGCKYTRTRASVYMSVWVGVSRWRNSLRGFLSFSPSSSSFWRNYVPRGYYRALVHMHAELHILFLLVSLSSASSFSSLSLSPSLPHFLTTNKLSTGITYIRVSMSVAQYTLVLLGTGPFSSSLFLSLFRLSLKVRGTRRYKMKYAK